ncbi:MAG: class I tRNA ligase family protein, partial [Deltaproteobacteria bacterium]|nr:class I tRNA ligase family protein [Deltaproteobacteria bacterium]
WIHNGFVNINSEKMSKSLGNVFNVKDILKAFPPEVLRFFLVQSHYRGPLDFSDEAVREAGRALERIFRAVEAADACLSNGGAAKPPDPGKALEGSGTGRVDVTASTGDEAASFADKFRAAMDDDLNTSQALGFLFDAVHALNRRSSEGDVPGVSALKAAIVAMGDVLGLDLADHAGFFSRLAALKVGEGAGAGTSKDDIDARITLRNEARAKKEWAEADRIRKELSEMGIVLEDRGGSTSWRYA